MDPAAAAAALRPQIAPAAWQVAQRRCHEPCEQQLEPDACAECVGLQRC
jgi:hypothetical protein